MTSGGNHYTAYGLRVRSEIELPYFRAASAGEPDVTVRCDAVPKTLPESARTVGLWQAAPNDLLLNLGDSVRYRVTGGREIVVERLDGADDDLVATVLIGTVWTGLLQQRGLLTLHGSAIRTDAGAVAFLGPSGSGKSTLAAALAARGHAVLTDDVAAIRGDAADAPLLVPGFPFLRLWADALNRLQAPPAPLRRVRAELSKHLLPVVRFSTAPAALLAAYILAAQNRTSIELAAVRPTSAVRFLCRNTRGWKLVNALGHQRSHFEATTRIARNVPVVRVTRPAGAFEIDALADCIEHDIQERCAVSPIRPDHERKNRSGQR